MLPILLFHDEVAPMEDVGKMLRYEVTLMKLMILVVLVAIVFGLALRSAWFFLSPSARDSRCQQRRRRRRRRWWGGRRKMHAAIFPFAR